MGGKKGRWKDIFALNPKYDKSWERGSWIGRTNKDLVVEINVQEAGCPTHRFKSDKVNYPKLINLIHKKFGLNPFFQSKKQDDKEKNN